MKLKIKVLNIIFLVLFFSLFSVKSTFAANVQFSGKVTDGSNNPITNTTITVVDTSSQVTTGTTTTDANGNYSLGIPKEHMLLLQLLPHQVDFRQLLLLIRQ